MRLLPSEKKERIATAIQKFEQTDELSILEPCDCGGRVSHNNGGNYHDEIYLQKDSGQVFVKYDTTSELTAPAEWEVCEDWKAVITENADWL